MRTVILESPFSAPTSELLQRNIRYARACLKDCLSRGEAPIASHLLFPPILDDNLHTERTRGIEAGLAWYRHADAGVFYTNLGMSMGMLGAQQRAEMLNVPCEFRTLPGEWI